MSINYNDALSPYDHKGKVGMRELMDDEAVLEKKISQLATMLRRSWCAVAIVGAGISTAAGIADFRGPDGVWTREKEKKEPKSVDFAHAHPTFTHYALVALERAGILKYVVSQNVDGLCGRSGFPMDRLAELHGNVFCERCDKCGRFYYRTFAIGSVGNKPTGRVCEGTETGRRCRGKLHDVTLDWEGELPEPQYTLSCKFAAEADVLLCLGTSLQIVPVGNFPLTVQRNKGKVITINLQATKHEKRVDLPIHCKVDKVMRRLLQLMNISVDGLDERPMEDPVLHSINPLFQFKKAKRKGKKEESEEPEEKRRQSRRRSAEEEEEESDEDDDDMEVKYQVGKCSGHVRRTLRPRKVKKEEEKVEKGEKKKVEEKVEEEVEEREDEVDEEEGKNEESCAVKEEEIEEGNAPCTAEGEERVEEGQSSKEETANREEETVNREEAVVDEVEDLLQKTIDEVAAAAARKVTVHHDTHFALINQGYQHFSTDSNPYITVPRNGLSKDNHSIYENVQSKSTQNGVLEREVDALAHSGMQQSNVHEKE